jgi:hypothetical protein
VAKEHDPQIIGPVPPQPVIPPAWLQTKFEQIENLQLLIIKQQGDLETALDTINAESLLLWSKVRELEALCSNEVIPELEKIINKVSRRATIIDEKVVDAPPPMPPVIEPPA